MRLAMGQLEKRQDGEAVSFYLDGKPVAEGDVLEVMTLWGWRSGTFVAGDRPALRMADGQLFPLDSEPLRWPVKHKRQGG